MIAMILPFALGWLLAVLTVGLSQWHTHWAERSMRAHFARYRMHGFFRSVSPPLGLPL